ncbi:DUF5666 domain-containing protein [Vibrio atypicus]|uniref:DUF5666 domain-containing protein n=1 Tax=Vibrio atypicus TaxID=558271 RepID=UPI003735DB6A
MKKLALVSLMGLVLVGCGGGSGSDSDSGVSVKPTSLQGTIDSVSGDSIVVNGYSYQVTSVTYNNETLVETKLQPNMTVEISPASSAARSTSSGVIVNIEPTMVGEITEISEDRKSFKVNGVHLTISSSIKHEIENDDWVIISSLPSMDENGPTYKVLSVVKLDDLDIPTENEVEVEGLISNLNKDDHTFKIGPSLTVSYSNLATINLEEGLWVEVEGYYDNSSITATEIEIEDYQSAENGAEIEGVITWVSDDKSAFKLNYSGSFVVTPQTRYEDGNQQDIALGKEVEVTSRIQGSHRVVTEIEFESNSHESWVDYDFEGEVSESSKSNFVIFDETRQKYFTIYSNKNTEFESFSYPQSHENLEDLERKRVEVEAIMVNNEYIATEIELDTQDD